MKELKLRILGSYINLNVNGTGDIEQNQITVNYYLKDIKEWPKKKTARTLPIRIYQTPQIREIFGAAFNIDNVNAWNLQSRVDAELYEDNVCLLRGFIFIDTINSIQNYYDVVLASNDVDIYNRVSDRLLTDLSFGPSSYDHNITKSYVLNQFNNPSIGQSPLLYNIVDWNGEIVDVQHLQLRDHPILPAYNALFLFDKIMDDNGFTYSMGKDTSTLLSKVYIPWDKEVTSILPVKNYVRWIGNSSIDISINAAYMSKLHMHNGRRPMSTLPTQNSLHFDVSPGDFSEWYLGGNNNEISTCPLMQSGFYKVVLTLDVSCPSYAVGSTVGGSLVGWPWGTNWSIIVGGSDNTITWATFPSVPLVLGDHKYTLEADVYFPSWSVMNPVLIASDTSVANIGIQRTSTFELFSYSWPYAGDVSINLNNALPQNYYQKDFISDFLTYFNAWIITDPTNPNNLLIKTFAEYFNDLIYVDWSDKFDDSQDNFFETCSKYIAQQVEFTSTQDSDTYSADYADKFPQPLYYLSKLNTSDLPNSGVDSIQIFSSPTSITPVGNIYVPQIFDKTGKASWKPRLLFGNSFTNDASYHILVTNDGTLINPPNKITTLTPFSTTNFADPSTVFLGWDNSNIYLDKKTITGGTVFNAFYKNELDMLLHKDARMLTGKFRLNPEDAENCFSKKIYISNPKIGDALYRVNSILNYSNSRSLCDVELIKIVNVPITWPATISPNLLTLNPLTSNSAGGSSGGSGGGSGGGSSTLAGLTDVKLTEPSTGQGLVYDADSGLWVNATGFGQDPSIVDLYSENIAEDVSIAYLNTHKVSKSGDTMTGNLRLVNNARLQTDNIDSSTAFFSGFAGSGMQMARNSSSGFDATFDNLTVRQQMKVYELQIQKISSVNGGIIVSAANGKAYDVSTSKIYFDENGTQSQIQFVANDYIRAQQWLSTGTRNFLGQVVAVHHNPSTGFAYIDFNYITGTPWAGADLVQVGNSTDTTRQNVIYITAQDVGNPYIDILAGVNAGSFTNKTKVRVGALSGITDYDFSPSPLTGYGLYGNGDIYLKGNIQLVNSTPCASIAVVPSFQNITVSTLPTPLQPPSGSGLFLSPKYMGYYSAGTFKTYMDSSGNFLLGNPSTAGMSWNQNTTVLNIAGAINITSGTGFGNITDRPNSLKTPSGAGLYIDASYFGYYSGSVWNSYIDWQGNCNFKGVGSFEAATVTESGHTMGIAISGDDIYENFDNGDAGTIFINRKGYNGGNTKRRQLIIGDGIGNDVLSCYYDGVYQHEDVALVWNALQFFDYHGRFVLPKMTAAQARARRDHGYGATAGEMVFITDWGAEGQVCIFNNNGDYYNLTQRGPLGY
jgi:hypothetical protein